MARKARGEAAVGYSRFSDEKQGSIPEQEGINEELAEQYGHPLVARFSDAGISRTVQDRPGLMAMFDYIGKHPEVGFIIVNELERLTAGIAQRAEVVEFCQRRNVWMLTEDMDPIDPFDDDAMHEADQRAVAAKGEVLKIRRRVRRNLRQKVINGTVAMRPAFGVRMKPLVVDGVELKSGQRIVTSNGRMIGSGELEVHPEEYPWLVRIFEWADAGLGSEEIARRLTREGVPTKSGNARWRGVSVLGILDNPLYKGEMVWGKQAVRRYSNGKTYLELRDEADPGRVVKPSPLGALIEPELWDRVAARRAGGQGTRIGFRGKYGVRLLDGFVYCAKCGNKCYAQRNNTHARKDGTEVAPTWRYVCSGGRVNFERQPGFDEPCRTVGSMSEVKIVEAMGSYRTNSAVVTVRPIRRLGADVEEARARLEGLIAQATTEQVNAQRLAITGRISDEMLDETLTDTAARIADAEAKLEALTVTEIYPDSSYVVESFNAMVDLAGLLLDAKIPVEDRRTALRDIGIERIYIDRPTIGIEFSLDAVEETQRR